MTSEHVKQHNSMMLQKICRSPIAASHYDINHPLQNDVKNNTTELELDSTELFTARAYARAVFGVVILSVCPSATRVGCNKTK